MLLPEDRLASLLHRGLAAFKARLCGFGFGMVSGVAPVSVAGCVGWNSTLVVLMLLISHGRAGCVFLSSTRKLLVSSPPDPLYISKKPLLA